MGDYNDQDNKFDNQSQQNSQDVNQQSQPQQPSYQQPPQYQQPQYQQPQYQQPQYQSQYQQPVQPDYQHQQYQDAEPKPSVGMAVASMVLGIVSFLLSCIFYLSIPAAIVGLILGILSIRGRKGGKGMAITGIILSGIGILIAIIIVAGAAAFLSNEGFMEDIFRDYNYDIY